MTFTCVHAASFCQYDSLLNQPSAKRASLLHNYYSNQIDWVDTAILLRQVAGVRAAGEKAKDKGLLMEADLMQAIFYSIRQRTPPSLAASYFQRVRTALEEMPDDDMQARLEALEGSWNWDAVNNYELAFTHWYHALALRQKQGAAPSDIYGLLYRISLGHYYFKDYKSAAYSLKQLLNLPPPGSPYILQQASNTLGLCYQELGNLDSADYYFNASYRYAVKFNSPAWQSIVEGNLGNDLFLRGKYAEAIPLLQQDVDSSLARRDWTCASGSQMVLADISLRQNDIAKAAVQLNNARQFVYRSDQYSRRKKLYPLLSKLYAAEGNYALAAAYLDSSIYVRDSLARAFDVLQMMRANERQAEERRQKEETALDNERKIKLIERNVLLTLVVLLMVISFLWYKNIQRKNKLKDEKNRRQLEATQNELDLAALRLSEFTHYISEKNDLITRLQQDAATAESTTLSKLYQATILTEDEWEHFRQLFEKVHTGFFHRLKEKLPGLTPAETRFMALAKLKLNNKEMTAMLGVGQDAIRQYRSRLRRKLNLPEDGAFEDLADSI